MTSIDKDGNKIITLPVFNILISITEDGSGGSIVSDLHVNEETLDLLDDNEVPDEERYNASIDGIESMILGHAISGVDVTSDAYIEGIETAVESCANNF